MAHRTRNRVPQYEHVAMPNRSTFVGGPPPFGQLNATGPCWPAGAIGCWVGGGGGGDPRARGRGRAGEEEKVMEKERGATDRGGTHGKKTREDPQGERT